MRWFEGAGTGAGDGGGRPVGPQETDLALTDAAADRFAALASKCARQEYPNKLDHVMNNAAEVAYFGQPGRRSLERTYGWAWLLKRAAELRIWDAPEARRWSAALRPLADRVVTAYLDFLPKQTYPIRTGVHPNSAFSLDLALDYARAAKDTRREVLMRSGDRHARASLPHLATGSYEGEHWLATFAVCMLESR